MTTPYEMANGLIERNSPYEDDAAKMIRALADENEELKQIMVTAIKAGDWIVDGACDPDQYIGDRL